MTLATVGTKRTSAHECFATGEGRPGFRELIDGEPTSPQLPGFAVDIVELFDR